MTEAGFPRPDSTPPASDQLEVSVFGPGVGECILVHLGEGKWLMVDSCRGRGRARPAAIEYLDSIGQSASHIALIVATHWHDDHVKGISEVYQIASDAVVYVTGAVGEDELLASTGYDPYPGSRFTSGIGELAKLSEEAVRRGTTLQTAVVGQRIWLTRGMPVSEVWTLSPSHKELDIGRRYLAEAIRGFRPGERRIPAQTDNDASVALYLETSMGPVVLGGDLEQRVNDRARGWSAVIDHPGLPSARATCFKLPHHGSANGHCQEFWDLRVTSRVYAVLTPFDRGQSSLPRETDRVRIRGLTTNTVLTSDKRGRVRRSDRVTEKTVTEVVREYAPTNLLMGHVQLRDSGDGWRLAATEEATQLG